jgi:gliding motility-associated-like protein
MSMAAYTASSCDGTFTQIACATTGGASANMPGITLNNLTPGQLIFIRVWDRVCNNIFQCGLPADGYQQGTFQICVNETFNSTPPTTTPGTGGYNCNNTPRAGNTCETATPICTFNGFCGSTSGYSANYWYNGSRGLGGPLNAQGIFCGSIENNSFIRFVAGSTSVVLDVIVSGSASRCGDGVQFMMFGNPTGGPSCQSLDIVSYGCESPMPPGTNRFVANGLTIGQEYYLMVDGFGGDICNYQINAISGVLVSAAAGQEERTVCLGETVPLSVFGAGPGTITWSGPFLNQTTGQTVTATPTAPGRYQYIVEAPNISPLCSGRNFDYDTVYVTVVNPFADFNLSQSGGCSGSGTTLTASGGFTYVWGPAPGVPQTSGPSITVNPTTLTTYTVTATNSQGCKATKSIVVGPGTTGPQLTVSSNKDTACAGTGGITLTASSGFSSYTWAPATGLSSTTGQTVTANPVNPNNYTYTVTATLAGCPNATAQKTITIISGGPVTVSPSNPNICSGQSVTLTASPAGNYNWTAPGFTQNGAASITVSPTTNTTYTATSTACPASGSSTVNVTPSPVALNAVNGSRCGTGVVNLSVTGNCSGTILWFDAPTGGVQVATGNSYAPSVSTNTTYYVSCTVNNCEGPRIPVTASLTNNPPNIFVTPTAELSCTTGQATLSGGSSTPGVTLSWSGPGIVSGGNTGTPLVNAAGTYTLTVTNTANGCTASADVLVSLNTNQPNADAGPNQTITCANSSLTLNGSSSTPGVSFSWTGPGITGGGNTATPTVNQPGTYTLIVTNNTNGCSSTDQVTVGIDNTPPDISIANPGSLDCSNPSLTLNASSSVAGLSYTWTGPGIVSGGNTANPTINTPGTYSVTVTNPANGCTNTASVIVSGGSNVPSATISTPVNLTCAVTSVTLTGSSNTPGVTFSWSGPGIVSGGSTANATINAPGTYTLTVTDPSTNCSNSASVNIVQDIVAPTVSILTPNEINCIETEVILSANVNPNTVSYQWLGPGIVSGGNSANATVNASGSYTLFVTNSNNGCTASDQVTVVQNNTPPDLSISSPATLTCLQAEISLQANSSVNGLSFNWTGPGIVSGGNTANPTINAPGSYSVFVSNPANGCTNSSSVTVSQSADIPVINIAPPAELTCINTQIILNASSSVSGVNYSWSGPGIVSGGNTSSPSVNAAGNYTVTVTNPSDGCTSTESVDVIANTTIPDANAGADAILTCSVTSLILNGSSSTTGASFSWAGPGIISGGNTASPSINNPGTYVLTVVDPTNGCTATDQVAIMQDITTPDVSITPPGVLDCNTSNIVITGSSGIPNASFSWTGPGIISGGNTAAATVDEPGIYTLTVTNPVNGCTASSQVTVNGDPNVPVVNLSTPSVLTCLVSSIDITAQSSISGSTFTWSGPGIVSGGSTSVVTINQPGTYTVTVTNPANACSRTESVIVIEDRTQPSVSIAPPEVLTCATPQVTLAVSGSVSGLSFIWSGPGIVGSNAQPSVSVNQPGIYAVTVTNPQNGCSAVGSVNVTEDKAVPSLNVTADPFISCSSGTANATASSTTQGVSFAWTGPGIVGNPDQGSITVNTAGTYLATVKNPANGCSDTSSVEILPAIPFEINADIIPNPCPQVEAGAIFLTISGGNEPFLFQWSNGTSGKDLLNVAGGSYNVTVNDAAGCSQQLSFTVPQGIFQVKAYQDANIEFGDSVEIYGEVTGGSGTFIVSWSPADYLSCTQCSEATAKPFNDIFYVFTAVDSNGCESSDTIFINVNTDFDIFFPNAFTPNGDRLNDQFRALGRTDLVTSYLLQIFNRWGELVFETRDISKGWDGTHKGQPVSSDGFIHSAFATFIDGKQRSYKGVVMVLR